MTDAGRSMAAGIAGTLLFAFLLWGFWALPQFGHYPGPYGDVLDAAAPRERHIPNVVSAVNFDYRGADTLGEEFILFAAVAGITMVLRVDRGRTTKTPLKPAPGRGAAPRTDAMRLFSIAAIGVTLSFGTYLALHPHLTPGGGFQGAAIAAGFAALAFIGLGFESFERVLAQPQHETAEAIGAGAYAVIGLATMAASGAFLTNVLPLGGEGQFFSGGTIPLINFFVGVEVFAGFVLMFVEFARETRVEEETQ